MVHALRWYDAKDIGLDDAGIAEFAVVPGYRPYHVPDAAGLEQATGMLCTAAAPAGQQLSLLWARPDPLAYPHVHHDPNGSTAHQQPAKALPPF